MKPAPLALALAVALAAGPARADSDPNAIWSHFAETCRAVIEAGSQAEALAAFGDAEVEAGVSADGSLRTGHAVFRGGEGDGELHYQFDIARLGDLGSTRSCTLSLFDAEDIDTAGLVDAARAGAPGIVGEGASVHGGPFIGGGSTGAMRLVFVGPDYPVGRLINVVSARSFVSLILVESKRAAP